MDLELPDGVSLFKLKMNPDSRGIFTEIYRESWFDPPRPLQWNVVSSSANVLRGVHVHIDHTDYLFLIQGRALFALRDLRKGSPTEGRVSLVEADEEKLQGLVIPPGVAHGFYFHTPSIHLYGVTEYWNPDDELGCHFADPQLQISWPNRSPILSERDENLPALDEILDRIPPWRPHSKQFPNQGGRERLANEVLYRPATQEQTGLVGRSEVRQR
jgi:dTDP-4-dehydrorhamnose 3,5-epimerase